MPDGGVERAAGPCAPIGEGAAEGFDLEADGSGQGTDSLEAIYEISVPSEETVLGQPLLGKGILCGHRGGRCRDHT